MEHASARWFVDGLAFFEGVAAQLSAEQWDGPSACQGWTARDVLGHLGTALDMGERLLRGEQPQFPEAERPGDLVEGEPLAWYQERARGCADALAGADLDLEMDTPMGKRTVADRLAFPALDLYIHAWDIGQPAGFDVVLPEDLMAFGHHYLDPIPAEMMRGDRGVFAAEVEPPVDATPTEAFVAWTGRQPRGM